MKDDWNLLQEDGFNLLQEDGGLIFWYRKFTREALLANSFTKEALPDSE